MQEVAGTSRSRRNRVAATLLVACLGILCLAGGASAQQLRQYAYEDSFNGSDSSAGAMTGSLQDLTIDQSNGHLFALDAHGSDATVSQFNANGEAVPFSELNGSSSLTIAEGGSGVTALQYDNSLEEGGLYVLAGPLRAYKPGGGVKWGYHAGCYFCWGGFDVAVDEKGGVYLTEFNGVQKFDPEDGSEIGGFLGYLYEHGAGKLEFDTEGHYIWTDGREGGLVKTVAEDECTKNVWGERVCEDILKFNYGNDTNVAIDPSNDYVYALEEGKQVTEYSAEGQPITTFGLPEGSYGGLGGAKGIAVDGSTHDVYVTSTNGGGRIDVFRQQPPITVPTVTTLSPGHPEETAAVFKGTINAEGAATTGCKFEWGRTSQYTNGTVPCDQGDVFGGSSDNAITATVESLTPGTTYHYRLVSKNANGLWTYGAGRSFQASVAPTSPAVLVDRVNTDGARFSTTIDPHGGTTHYRFEIGTEDCATSTCTSVPQPDGTLKSNLDSEEVQQSLNGLEPNTLYYVRLVAENGAGTFTTSAMFHTQPAPTAGDSCANARLRQATGAYLLRDCRAYELVSAPNAAGYDVESDLVPGQVPFTAYPYAPNRVLYGLHYGSIPGIAGEPPNYGVDPYVAERGTEGWTTRYVGLPSNGMADQASFGSPVLGADESLETFAFGGNGICNPCFEGLGVNLPVRYKGGAAVPGMPGEAAPAGTVQQYLSGDGSHLVFGSTRQLAPGGVEGALTLYERELPSGPTQVVSSDSNGDTFSGPGTTAFGVSSDGSRVVTGERVATDAGGIDTYHLYMHVGGAAESVDLTPGASSGALFDGMTADGGKVFLTTTDQLSAADTDSSADIYEVEVGPTGAAGAPQLVSVMVNGSPSNDDSCSPLGSPRNWNSDSTEPGRCGAVAFAGGAGVAAGDGTLYFVSPEQLDGGEGAAGEVNLYVVEPGGTPRFVGTIDSSANKAPPLPPQHPLTNSSFASVPDAEALAVDQSNGDVYVVRGEEGKLTRLGSNGAAKNFTAGPASGSNTIEGFSFKRPSGAGVAVDNAPASPLEGDFYVTAHGGPYSGVTIWSPAGENLGQLTGSATPLSSFGDACGVSVDPTNGTVYIGDHSGYIWKYMPSSPSLPLSDDDYTVTGIRTDGISPCTVSADGDGHVYGSEMSDGPAKQYITKVFAAGEPPSAAGVLVDTSSKSLFADPSIHNVYVDEGSQISVFNESGTQVGSISGSGLFSGSRGVAVNTNTDHVYVSSGSQGKIFEFGSTPTPYEPIDDPAVLHAVTEPLIRRYGDIQVTRNGLYATFATSQPLGSYVNLDHYEIYRYDSEGEALDCASCNPTLAPAKYDATLSDYGLNLTEDGRVFFTSREGLVLSDTNEKADAYEWEGPNEIGSISTGRSLSDSKLLSVSADGKDAFFFTRDVLVQADENGGSVKIYDAREGGGFAEHLTTPPCAASDECHGPGSVAPPPPNINSIEGAELPGPEPEAPKHKCKKGTVTRHGKCVKKKTKKHHHRKAGRRHG